MFKIVLTTQLFGANIWLVQLQTFDIFKSRIILHNSCRIGTFVTIFNIMNVRSSLAVDYEVSFICLHVKMD